MIKVIWALQGTQIVVALGFPTAHRRGCRRGRRGMTCRGGHQRVVFVGARSSLVEGIWSIHVPLEAGKHEAVGTLFGH